MTGIEQHRALLNPLTHPHHHQTIMQTSEATTSSHNTSSRLTTDKLTTRDDEVHDLRLNTAQDPDRAATPDHPQDQSQGRRLSRESMIKIKSFQSRPPIGDNREVSPGLTPKDPSPTTNSSSFDNPTHLSPPESTNPASWKHESRASRSATTNTTSSRKIYNRWLNKEVPYTTMECSDSIRRPLMISSPNLDTSKTRTTTDQASSSTAITNRLNQTWDPPTQQPFTTLSRNSMGTPQISTSSSSLTSQSLDVSHMRKKFISQDRTTSLGDSLQNISSHQRPQDAHHHPNEIHHLDSSPPKRQLKAYNSDSSLATSYMEEKKQSLLKKHPEARASSKVDSSHKKSPPARPAPPASPPQVKQPRQKEPRSQWCLNRPPPEQSPQPKAALNKTLAETLWGKQLGEEENQTLCRNSLPRQSPASGARNKSLDEQLSEVEIEIQDILAQPLFSESYISSPSLFDETPTISSQSSSPQTTVQTIH